jgi:hypothetical protein
MSWTMEQAQRVVIGHARAAYTPYDRDAHELVSTRMGDVPSWEVFQR